MLEIGLNIHTSLGIEKLLTLTKKNKHVTWISWEQLKKRKTGSSKFDKLNKFLSFLNIDLRGLHF